MAVFDVKSFVQENRGASITEVLLAMAIIALATPFVYNQVARTNQTLRDIALAKTIMLSRDNILNFIRMNQGDWPENAQIKMDEVDLSAIAPDATAGFIDKYSITGASVTDVYLAFKIDDSMLHTNKIARHIGGDAAVVGEDGIAYGNTWAVAAPDFAVGDLIYRISDDMSDKDTSKYLHRATSGEDDFNTMQRDLNMARHNIHNVATLSAELLTSKNANTVFLNSDDISAQNVTVMNSIKVGNNLVLKSDSSRSISGFTMINTSSVLVPFVSTEEIIFYENFGLTISGELLMSTTAPLRIGNWNFPSTKPPAFSEFTLKRASKPSMPNADSFDAVTRTGWQTAY